MIQYSCLKVCLKVSEVSNTLRACSCKAHEGLKRVHFRLFTVSNDGVISINGDFTAAHFGEHRMFVLARDHGDPPRESKAEVIVSVYGTLITVATEPPTVSSTP